MPFKKNIIGNKYNRLTVIKLAHRKRSNYYYLCRCDCGKEKIIAGNNVKFGFTKSCGCFRKEQPNTLKHDLCKTRIYKIFHNMKSRCYNSKSNAFKNYGQRGITIYDDWLVDVSNFYKWAVSNGYNDSLTIERVDVNGNYEPSNCKWVSRREQNRNRRDSINITYKSETRNLADWCDMYNIKYSLVLKRLYRGWTIEKALTTKSKRKETQQYDRKECVQHFVNVLKKDEIKSAFKKEIERVAKNKEFDDGLSGSESVIHSIEEINRYDNNDFFDIILQEDIDIKPYLNIEIEDENDEEKLYNSLWEVFKEVSNNDYNYGFK